MALYVRNPGRMPLTVEAMAQTLEPELTWQPISGQIKTGVAADGNAEGEGHLNLANVRVPFGTRQIGVALTWDQPDATLSVSMYDPVAQGDQATATGADGQAVVMAANPVPGEWTIMAGVNTPGVETRTVTVKGALFLVAPRPLSGVVALPLTVQPGGTGLLPLTMSMPAGAENLSGRIVVTTKSGDRLGDLTFRIIADDGTGEAGAEAATTRS